MYFNYTLFLILIKQLTLGYAAYTPLSYATSTSSNQKLSTNVESSSSPSSGDIRADVAANNSASLDVNSITLVANKSSLSITGTADILEFDTGAYHFNSKLNVTVAPAACPTLKGNSGGLTQTQLIKRLTAPCRYDRLERPINQTDTGNDLPIAVYVRVYIYLIQNLAMNELHFKLHGLMQIRYKDPRLAFEKDIPTRNQPVLGEDELRNLIWVPHIILANEQDSGILGTDEKDVLTSIAPDGTVIISTRIQATLYCWMNLQKFPFDNQYCSTIFESWLYNSTQMVLHWEENSPIVINPNMRLAEYTIENSWSNETVIDTNYNNYRHGAFEGNYSTLSFTVFLNRESGFYMMDYFLPSMMIVAISWVSFWLQADQTPARTTLGCTTMLSFITLASSQFNHLPKVSYIKISEVWFFGCTLFIFGSLVEFAFVNTIWRRKKSLEMKKINSRNILKSTLTPNMMRRQNIYERQPNIYKRKLNNNTPLTLAPPVIITEVYNEQNEAINESKLKSDGSEFSTITPHEASSWIDRKARFMFPIAFIIFNAIFWSLVYCL